MALMEMIQNNPRISLIIFAFIITAVITVITYFMTDQKRMKEIKERQKSLKAELKIHKNNPEKMMELNNKMMEDIPEQLRLSMKPMLITIIPLLIFFGWMRSTYATTAIASTWLWWYIGSSIIFSISLRKIFRLQ